jgi:hypothetical protein
MAENNDVKIEDHDVKLPITNNDRTPQNMYELPSKARLPSHCASSGYLAEGQCLRMLAETD